MFTLFGIAVLCGLGTWQLQRLEWKEKLLGALDTEYTKDAAHTELVIPGEPDNFLFRRGTLRGVYDFEKQVLVGPRVYGNIPGWHVITPLKLGDGSWILVNRGWVPQHWPAADETGKPRGRVGVAGLLRLPDNNPFAPPNVPGKDQWYSINTLDIGAARKIWPVHDYVLYEENGDDTTNYPLAAATRPHLENNHLQYAIFWFTMAGILAIIYLLRFLRK